MENRINHISIDAISSLSMKELDAIKNEVESRFNAAKEQKEIIEEVLNIRFYKKTQELLNKQGTDTGTIHFEEEDFLVSAMIPKKVIWDQEKLSILIDQLPNEERNRYIETTYKVNEQRYLANFPLSLRGIFDEAREVSTGKLKLTLKLKV